MTNNEFLAELQACKFGNDGEVSSLITSSHTNVEFDKKVYERSTQNPVGAYNYFSQFFGTEVWPDGVGNDRIREYYAPPYIPFTFERFSRAIQVCDPNLANECDFDMCEVPEGARGTLPPFRMLKWGFETPRTCIANIRSIRDFRYWASKIIEARQIMDEQTMNMFYTLAAIQTTGHKLVMQGVRDANNNLNLVSNSNPRNPLKMGLYNYMEDLFPQLFNANDLVPVTIDHLQKLARHWDQAGATNDTGVRGPRGEKIWEMWTPDDWYYDQVYNDADMMERLKYFKPANLFAGTKLDSSGQREIIQNWAMKTMPWLPRFAVNTNNEVVPVDSHVGVDIEVGKEYVSSIEFDEAPIGMMVMVSGKQGTIMTRPTLSTSGEGFAIQPIASNTGWIINNDYDPICNKYKNKPFSYKHYEMGFRMDDPDAAMAFLYRRKKFNMRPINDCDLAPIVPKPAVDNSCPITTVGCNTGKVRVPAGITKVGNTTFVECTASACGNTGSGTSGYRIKVERRVNQPDFNSIGCACGSAVTLFIHDEEGEFDRTVQGVLKDDTFGFPTGLYFVEIAAPLADGECIRGITCTDDTPLQGNVIEAVDASMGFVGMTGVTVFLDSPLGCPEGQTVQVRYYNQAGLVIGTINATIAEAWPEQQRYRLTSSNPGFAAQAFEGQVRMGVSCSQSPNASSSSSGEE